MKEQNMKNEIQSIKDIFKNIRHTLSYEEISDIRLKIYRNEKIYEYYTSKTKLDKKQKVKLNDAINNLNNLHEYLLNKNMKIRIYIGQINFLMRVNNINLQKLSVLLMEIIYFMKVMVITLVLYLNILRKLNLIYMI